MVLFLERAKKTLTKKSALFVKKLDKGETIAKVPEALGWPCVRMQQCVHKREKGLLRFNLSHFRIAFRVALPP